MTNERMMNEEQGNYLHYNNINETHPTLHSPFFSINTYRLDVTSASYFSTAARYSSPTGTLLRRQNSS